MGYYDKIVYEMIDPGIYTEEERLILSSCTLCPRECGIDRFEATGYCGADAGLNIASICIHRGEEPPISGPQGICNIFFAGCNLRCFYCQNYDISHPVSFSKYAVTDLTTCVDTIEEILSKGIYAVGFVSPSHVVPQVKSIIRELGRRGYKPVTVYNTNSYDKVETLKELEGLIDVYLPDYKYVSPLLAARYSDAPDYPEVAIKALKEMYYQKGSVLHTDENGVAYSGMLIRHLVLPGHTDNSIGVLRSIAEEISTGVHLSLMSQYHPAGEAISMCELNRPLTKEEYSLVAEEMERLGFRNGWLQEPKSCKNYLPDFSREHPFEW